MRAAGWPLERVLFALAGTVTLVSAVLAAVVSPWLVVLTGFVGVSQWLYVRVVEFPRFRGRLMACVGKPRKDGVHGAQDPASVSR